MPPRFLVLAAVVAALLLAPSLARAGTYDVYSCRLPDGSPAPTDGWRPFGSPDGIPGFPASVDGTTDNRCRSGGGLEAALASSVLGANTRRGWTFAAPVDLRLRGVSINRFVSVGAPAETLGARGYLAFVGPWGDSYLGATEGCGFGDEWSGCETLGEADSLTDPTNRLVRTGLDASEVSLGVRCFDGLVGSCPERSVHPGELVIRAAQVRLEDSAPPRLADDALSGLDVVQGVIRRTFVAADVGSGLRRYAVLIDGIEVRAENFNGDTTCHEPFVAVVPCPLGGDGLIEFDSASLPDGRHTLQLVVVDASGNVTRSPVREMLVKNQAVAPAPSPEALNGANATRFARLSAWFDGKSRPTERTVSHGQALTVSGKLTNADGSPIGGAILTSGLRVVGLAATTRPSPSIRTNGSGEFHYALPAGPSRVLEIAYRAGLGDPAPVATARVSVRVRAGVTLRTSSNRVRNGKTLRFSGRVLGEGNRRALVTIYALSSGPRKRIPVETVRARADGRFRYSYKFRSIWEPSVYRFVARVPKQTGFPYLEGASKVVTVRGRP